MEKLKIIMGNGNYIVASIFDYADNELCVAIEDPNGNIIQDLVTVRSKKGASDISEVLVWDDECCEGYTNKFEIKQYYED